MISHITPTLTALQAQAITNLFLSENLPDRFTADQPHLSKNEDVWLVPVILSYPFIGSVGQVGEIIVSIEKEEVITHTPLAQIKKRATGFYESRRDEIEAAFS